MRTDRNDSHRSTYDTAYNIGKHVLFYFHVLCNCGRSIMQLNLMQSKPGMEL